MMSEQDIENRFTYHAPTPEKVKLHEDIRNTAKQWAVALNYSLPDGREKSLAITHLEEVVMWANAAIARN